jgi:folate-dependent phosphoribosylglycinamide formyltransferase PurN
VDSGPILDQRSFRIDSLRTAEEVEARGLPIEHELYAKTIDWFVSGGYRVENRGGEEGSKTERRLYVRRT